MATIKDSKGQILAHHTTESPLSHYGQAVWVVEVEDPKPGPIILELKSSSDSGPLPLDLIEVKDGWLIAKLPDGYLIGIFWQDGIFYMDYLVDSDFQPIKELGSDVFVKGTLDLGDGSLGYLVVGALP